MRPILALPLILALAACHDAPPGDDGVPDDGDGTETDVVDTDAGDTDAVETDAGHTDAVDTDVVDTDGGDTDVVDSDPADTDAPDSDGADTAGDSEVPADTDTPPVDTDTPPADTDVADTEVPPADTDTGDSAAGVPAPWNHDVVSVVTAARRASFDLDGNGTRDNALAGYAAVLDPLLAQQLAATTTVLVLQVAGVADLGTGISGDLALIPATDLDGDASDNGSGVEPFDPGPGVLDADGVALVSTPVALSGGAYATVWSAQSIVLGGTTYQTATPIHVAGTVTPTSHDGVVGFGLSTATVQGLLTSAGQGSLAVLVPFLADLDTDGNGTKDALSLGVAFHATSCLLTP